MNCRRLDWDAIAPKLREAGIDPEAGSLKNSKLAREGLISQIYIDEVSLDNTDDLAEWADGYLEEHPAHETVAHRRKRNLEETTKWDSFEDDDEFTGQKYAVISYQDRHTRFLYFADDLKGLVDLYASTHYQSEHPEYFDPGVIDLDTGETAFDEGDFKVELKITLGDETILQAHDGENDPDDEDH